MHRLTQLTMVIPLATMQVLAAGMQAASPSAQAFELHEQGYGPVHVGMTIPEAEKVISTRLVPADDSSPADGCWHVRPAYGHGGVQFMVQQGRISRASVGSEPSPIRTDRGVGIGDTEERVRQLYGERLSTEPHEYLGSTAHYLTYWNRDASRGLRFETNDQGRVEMIHAGDHSIQLIEGCS